MTADRRLPARWLLALSLLLSWQAHSTAADDSPSEVRIENGRVDITLTASEKQYTLPAKIRVSLLLRNSTDKRDAEKRVFPIAAPPLMRFPQLDTPWCRVTVNDISVNFEKKLVVDPTEQTRARPDGKQALAWSKRLEEWFAKDEELMKLVERYRRLASVRIEMRAGNSIKRCCSTGWHERNSRRPRRRQIARGWQPQRRPSQKTFD